MKPRKPVKRRRSKPRRGPWRSVKYLRWIAEHWCCVRYPHMKFERLQGVTMSQAAHTQNNGTSSKGPDSTCVPLSPDLHFEYDAGRKVFEKKYGVDMQEIAKQYFERWLSEQTVNLSSYAFNKYGHDAKLYNGIHDLETKLEQAESRLRWLDANRLLIQQVFRGCDAQRLPSQAIEEWMNKP